MTRYSEKMGRLLALVLVAIGLVPAAAGAAVPNDPGWSDQWNLRTIRADKAWPVSRGSGVVVAVIDTGVDLKHPDLKARLAPGRDFVDGDSSPADANGHGTHVAGTIAATTDNGEGIASVAPQARIMPVRVLDAKGQGSASVVADGIRWAVSNGADVINLSLAQDGPGLEIGILGQNLLASTAIDEAVKDAAAAGALVTIAAGNNFDGGDPETAYDATVPGVLVVGASTKTDGRAAYSNYGTGLDVLAPGGGSASDPDACSSSSAIVSTWWDPSSKESTYGTGCGTSMAVAHVSGVGALLMSLGRTNRAAADRIQSTATDLGPPGRDDQTGFGRVDAARAVGTGAARSAPAPSPTALSRSSGGVGAAGFPKPVASGTGTPVGRDPRAPAAPLESPAVASPPREPSPPGDQGPVGLAAGLAVAVAIAHRGARAWLRSR